MTSIWDFSFFSSLTAPLCAYKAFLFPYCPFSFSPLIFLCSPSPCVWFWGYALLTHSHPPALWTLRLPTDNHMLPQPSSGKRFVSSAPLYFHTNVCHVTGSTLWARREKKVLCNKKCFLMHVKVARDNHFYLTTVSFVPTTTKKSKLSNFFILFIKKSKTQMLHLQYFIFC